MVKNKKISPPQEEITDLELTTQSEVSQEDKKKQADYERRHSVFMKEFQKLEKKHKIKLLQIPAKLIYYDTKYEENN
jgi:ABC-type Zn uptake system ZnuABC Zn-binding protein ZnuA